MSAARITEAARLISRICSYNISMYPYMYMYNIVSD